MKLYHGTRGSVAKRAMIEGIAPRGRRKGNFGHSIESSKHHVYLTDAYAAYFAFNATRKESEAAIIEVDTRFLFPLFLNADEDVLEQAGRGRDHLNPEWDMKKRTRWYRDRLHLRQWDYKTSLEAMGTCAHLGTIAPNAITRIAFIDMKHPNLELLRVMSLDPAISIINYQLMQKKYRSINRWIFGDNTEDDEPTIYNIPDLESTVFKEYPWPPAEDRSGITLVHMRESTG